MNRRVCVAIDVAMATSMATRIALASLPSARILRSVETRDVEPIGERIQAVLERLQKTPAWLAEMAGVPRSTITRAIKRERIPSSETLQEIAPHLELALEDLVRGTDAEARVKESRENVSRHDYEGAVRQVIEFERRANDVAAKNRELAADAERERQERKRERDETEAVRAQLRASERACAQLQTERDHARDKAMRHEEAARRYREGLERAVADVARLRQQVRELGAAVDASHRTGSIGAMLAGVAAAVSVASYLGNDSSGSGSAGSSGAKRRKGSAKAK